MAALIHVNHHQKTKILATIGPASSSKEALLDLVKAGVNVFRLNFSHGAHTQHQEVIDNILEINEKYHVHVGILADLQGPKLRIGKIENNALETIACPNIIKKEPKIAIKLPQNKPIKEKFI